MAIIVFASYSTPIPIQLAIHSHPTPTPFCLPRKLVHQLLRLERPASRLQLLKLQWEQLLQHRYPAYGIYTRTTTLQHRYPAHGIYTRNTTLQHNTVLPNILYKALTTIQVNKAYKYTTTQVSYIWVCFLRTGIGPELCDLFKKFEGLL